jgi:hypothetical protein
MVQITVWLITGVTDYINKGGGGNDYDVHI